MHDLNYSIRQVCLRNRDGSFGTRANRERMLSQAADQLREFGFNQLKHVDQLKAKHVHRLVEHWQKEEISVGTQKNRMSALRWLSEKLGNDSLVARSNDHYGIPDREYANKGDRSLEYAPDVLDRIEDPHVRASADLQKAFGLRREEAIKIRPQFADRNDKLVLKASWCKGNIEREIPIRTDEQRAALDRAHEVAGKQSLIPSHKSYIQQVKTFEYQMNKIGYGQSHGARHLYAQERYRELSGMDCPAKGGKSWKELTLVEKENSNEAREIVSRELGHERKAITNAYLT